MPQIRAATAKDRSAIRELLVSAFPTDGEARIVECLRDNGKVLVELVAEAEQTDEQRIVGHIAFSPVSIGPPSPASANMLGVGLAPLCVAPTHERQGIGGRLVEQDGIVSAIGGCFCL